MNNNNIIIIIYIMALWFVISFVTNIIGPMMPMIISDYRINYTWASFMPFSFFLAYGIMSIPSGFLAEKVHPQYVILFALIVMIIAAITFSVKPVLPVFFVSLFLLGTGMSILQVVLNPLMRSIGGEQHYAFNAVMAQVVFGVASFLSPVLYVFIQNNIKIIENAIGLTIEPSWSFLYWIFVAVFLLLLILLLMVKIPKENNGVSAESIPISAHYKTLYKNNIVWMYFFGIISYVGVEQGVSNWMLVFLENYHGVNPVSEGVFLVSLYWGLMTVGCLLGLILVKFFDVCHLLLINSLFSIIALLYAIFGNKEIAIIAFPAIGFFISTIFSFLISLALNSVKEYHGALTSILCTGIFGGALFSVLIGKIADLLNLRIALSVMFIALAFILYVSLIAKPIIENKTISLKKMI